MIYSYIYIVAGHINQVKNCERVIKSFIQDDSKTNLPPKQNVPRVKEVKQLINHKVNLIKPRTSAEELSGSKKKILASRPTGNNLNEGMMVKI